jgi:hypothetical protein
MEQTKFKKSVISTAKLDTLADRFKYWTNTNETFTIDEMINAVIETGVPTPVADAERMVELLQEQNLGHMYRYIGESTDQFENGAIYIVAERGE